MQTNKHLNKEQIIAIEYFGKNIYTRYFFYLRPTFDKLMGKIAENCENGWT